MMPRLCATPFFLLLLLPPLVDSFRLLKEQATYGQSHNRILRRLELPVSTGSSRQSILRKSSVIHRVSKHLGTATTLSAAVRFKNFDEVLDSFHEPVIVYFATRNCGPCKLMKKELEAIREMVGKDLKIFSVDTEKWPHVGSRFAVAKLPCLVVFQQGEILLRFEGVNKAEEVVQKVRPLL